MIKITGRANSQVRFAKSVRNGNEEGLIFAEGIRLCEELLKSEITISAAYISKKLVRTDRGERLAAELLRRECNTFEIEESLMDGLSDTKTSQGLVILAEKPTTGRKVIEAHLSKNPFFMLLHQLNNPSNLGAILRTAEAAGVSGILATKGTVDIFSPKSLRSGMGSNLRLPIWDNADYKELLFWAKENGVGTVCADIGGQTIYTEIDWTLPKLLIIGSEGHGLTEEEVALADESLVIPMENDVESLNVAVACGAIMFEAKRQRRIK